MGKVSWGHSELLAITEFISHCKRQGPIAAWQVSSLQLHGDAPGTSNQLDRVRLLRMAGGSVIHLP